MRARLAIPDNKTALTHMYTQYCCLNFAGCNRTGQPGRLSLWYPGKSVAPPHSLPALPAWTSSVTCHNQDQQKQAAGRANTAETYRAVIHQSHFHHSLKSSVLDPFCRIAFLYLADEVMIEPARIFR